MKITEEQRKVLDSFSCERLAGKPENMRIVEDFYNSRNPQLEQNPRIKHMRKTRITQPLIM